MTRQHRFAATLMAALSVSSVVQGLIMCAEVGLSDGWVLIRNDPGKFVFHLLLLPVASGALAWSFPADLYRRCMAERGVARHLTVALTAVLTLLALGIGVQEAVTGFKKRIPVPTDVRASVALNGAPVAARATLLDQWIQLHAVDWRPAKPLADATPPYSRERAAAYQDALTATLGSTRDFWSQASLAAWWSGLLSIAGIALMGAWIMTIIITALQRDYLDEARIATLVVAFCIGLAAVGVWFYFKIYSEWYINFYAVPSLTLAPLFMTLLATVILALTAVLVRHATQPLTWFGRFAAVSGFATGLTAYWRPELLRAVADAYRETTDSIVIGLWTVIGVTAFIAGYLTATYRSKSAPAAGPPAQVGPAN